MKRGHLLVALDPELKRDSELVAIGIVFCGRLSDFGSSQPGTRSRVIMVRQTQ